MSPQITRVFLVTVVLSATLVLALFVLGMPTIQTLLIAIIPWTFFLLFFFPTILLYAFLFTRPSLDRLSDIFSIPLPFYLDYSITLTQALGSLIVLLGIIFLAPRLKKFLKVPLFLPFTAMLIWGAGTLLYSISASETLYEILRLFSILFIFLLAYSAINSQKKFLTLLIFSALSAVIPILVALYQFINGIGYTDSSFAIPRIYGTFAHPNILALYLVVVLSVLLILFILHPKKHVRNASILSFFAVFSILILTYARAAWATFFVFLGFVSIIKYPKILPALILLPLGLFVFSPTIQERFYEGVTLSPSSSLTWRINIWQDTMYKTVSEQNIIFGYGLGTFNDVAENIRGIRFVVNDPHSEFVRSFVEGGVVGLTIFLIFSVAPIILFWKLWRKNKNDKAGNIFLILLSLWISLLLLSLTDHVLRSTMVQWILWAVIGGALRVHAKSRS